jgi:hypothetical protein
MQGRKKTNKTKQNKTNNNRRQDANLEQELHAVPKVQTTLYEK